MKRVIAAIGLLSVSACAHLMGPLASHSPPLYAELTVKSVPGEPFYELNGIVAIDQTLLKPHQVQVSIAEGRRTITYECPGTTSIDSYPQLQYKFHAGRRYELVCERKGEQLLGVVHPLP